MEPNLRNSFSDNNNVSPFESEPLDIKKYFFLILANWYWFVISIFVGLAISYMVNRYTKPVYQVGGSLTLNQGTTRSGLYGYENLIPGMEIYSVRKYVINEIEVLKSFSLAQRTLLKLDFGTSYFGVGRSGIKEVVLYNNCPFYVRIDSTKTNIYGHPINIDLVSASEFEIYIEDIYETKRRMKYGELFETPEFSFRLYLKDPENFIPKVPYNTYKFHFNSIISLSNMYKNKISISSNDEKRGGVLYLSLTENHPEKAAEYLNKIMEEYIQQGLEEKNQTVINTIDFIDSQLGIIDDSLSQAELNLENFRLINNLVDISSEGQIISQRLETLEQEKSKLELYSRYFNYLKKYINDKSNMSRIVAPSILDINDPLMTSLIEQLNAYLSDLDKLVYSVNPGNRQLINLEEKIENTRLALLDNIESMMDKNEIATSEVNKNIVEAYSDLKKIPVTERKLIGIQRDYKVNDQIYTYLLEKRAEAAIAKASNVADNRILDYAYAVNAIRVSPKTRSNNMLGLMGGIGIPFVIIILLELSNTKITSRKDIENRTKLPVIAHIGHSEKGDIPVFENPKSSLAESFRGLRTNLQYLLREEGQKVITVSSTISGEGKTFVSLNLATIFAMANKRTLLVGLDLRKPKLHRVFNLDNNTGLSSYLIGRTDIEHLIMETKVSNLYMVPSGPVPPNPAELLETKEMAKFLKYIRKEFDIVILDTPPFGVVTDSLLVGRHSDANLFIVRQNYSDRDVLNLMNEIQLQQGLTNLGIVFNDLSLKGYYRSGYKYYNYNYTYRYGYIYGSDYYHNDSKS